MSSREFEVDRAKLAKRPPIHPGIIFAEEVMPELRKNRTIADIAALLGVSRATLHRVMAGDIAISVDMALRMGKLCGNGPELWLSLQASYDTFSATRRLGKELERIPTIR
jgi:addiction module HigA family antidote